MQSRQDISQKGIGQIYDNEFYNYVSLSRGLIENLKDKEDRRICVRYIRKLCCLKSDDSYVKSNRNSFFRYLLQTLETIQDPNWLLNQISEGRKKQQNPKTSPFVHWSKDKRTYMAVQPLPGKGTLIYMAVSKDPNAGWDNVGKFVG